MAKEKDEVKETKHGEEPALAPGLLGAVKQKVQSMFGKSEPRKEGADEYHNRRTEEELKESGALDDKSKPISMGHSESGSIDHPALKILMAKLNLNKEEDEPAGKGGFSGIKV